MTSKPSTRVKLDVCARVYARVYVYVHVYARVYVYVHVFVRIYGEGDSREGQEAPCPSKSVTDPLKLAVDVRQKGRISPDSDAHPNHSPAGLECVGGLT